MDNSFFSLKQLNSFGVSAYSKQLFTIQNYKDLAKLSALKSDNLFVLGEGSNTLFVDEQAPAIIHIMLKGIEVEELTDAYQLTVAAGENWHQLVDYCIKNNMNGLENLALIPGSVGAAPVQNIGAYGVEFADFCQSVTWYDFSSASEKTFTKKECEFSYRSSIFKQQLKGKGIITKVTLLLPKAWQANLSYAGLDGLSKEASAEQVMSRVIALRKSKLPDPKSLPNAGSFFKNPIISKQEFNCLLKKYSSIPHYLQDDGRVKIAAAWLIDQAGLKGKRLGKVGIHIKQALVLVNYQNGSGKDLLNLARYVQNKVFKKFTLKIEPEVRLISSTGEKTIEELEHG